MVKSVERNRGKEMRFMRRIIMALMLATLVAFAVAGAAWVLVAPPPAKAAFPGQKSTGRLRRPGLDQHHRQPLPIWIGRPGLVAGWEEDPVPAEARRRR